MQLEPQISCELAKFDGKNISVLTELAARHADKSQLFDALTLFIQDEEKNMASAASWLSKFLLEQDLTLTTNQTHQYIELAKKIKNWPAKLHICQSIRLLDLSDIAADPLVAWLSPLLEHKRPFLRAWSLDALVHIADTHPAFRADALSAVANGLDDEAASVRARVRNITSNGSAWIKGAES